MGSPLETIISLASAPEAILDHADIVRWPEDLSSLISNLGLIQPTAVAHHVSCDQCSERHIEEVQHQQLRHGRTRFFITCPEAGRVIVDPSRLSRWIVDYGRLAIAVSAAFCGAADVELLVDGRAWRLGAINLLEQMYSVVLFRGAARSDAAEVLSTATTSLAADKTVLVVVDDGSHNLIPETRFAAIVSLASIIRIRGDKLWIDRDRIEAAIPSVAEITDKPIIDDATMSVTYRRKTCKFSSRSKEQFRLLRRLNRRPGHHVLFDTMRQPGEVFEDYETADASIRSAMRRLRESLKRARMERLAKCLKTGGGCEGYAVLDLSIYDSNSH